MKKRLRILLLLLAAFLFPILSLWLVFWNAWTFGAFLCLILGFLIGHYWRMRCARRSNPKDYAFAIFAEWGPKGRIPRQARLKSVFPKLEDALIDEWLIEFEAVDKVIWRIAEAGGAKVLGNAEVQRRLQQAYPYLAGPGLRQARFLVNYHAWHEGYSHDHGESL